MSRKRHEGWFPAIKTNTSNIKQLQRIMRAVNGPDAGTKSEERVFGCHFPHTPDCRAIPQLNCTPADWCLIVSGHRKLGAELISLFFHTKCGDAGPESPQCRELQGMSDQVLRDNIVKFMQRAMFNPSHRYSWWLHAMLTFHRAGLNFSLNDLVQHGVTELPNALWVVLPFEAGWKMRENILGKWLPGAACQHFLCQCVQY